MTLKKLKRFVVDHDHKAKLTEQKFKEAKEAADQAGKKYDELKDQVRKTLDNLKSMDQGVNLNVNKDTGLAQRKIEANKLVEKLRRQTKECQHKIT